MNFEKIEKNGDIYRFTPKLIWKMIISDHSHIKIILFRTTPPSLDTFSYKCKVMGCLFKKSKNAP
jgi:hypothetical protein